MAAFTSYQRRLLVFLSVATFFEGYDFFAITQLLPPKGRRWLSHKMGNDTVFLNFDTTARAGYEQRAQSAIVALLSRIGPCKESPMPR